MPAKQLERGRITAGEQVLVAAGQLHHAPSTSGHAPTCDRPYPLKRNAVHGESSMQSRDSDDSFLVDLNGVKLSDDEKTSNPDQAPAPERPGYRHAPARCEYVPAARLARQRTTGRGAGTA